MDLRQDKIISSIRITGMKLLQKLLQSLLQMMEKLQMEVPGEIMIMMVISICLLQTGGDKIIFSTRIMVMVPLHLNRLLLHQLAKLIQKLQAGVITILTDTLTSMYVTAEAPDATNFF